MSKDVDVPFPKAWMAYQLKMAGLDLREIADRCAYPSPTACAQDIRRHLKEGAAQLSSEDRETMLTLELDRLNDEWFELGRLEATARSAAPTSIPLPVERPVPDLSKEWN